MDTIFWVVAGFFLYCFGLMILNGRVSRMGIGDKPLAYESVMIKGVLSLSTIFAVILLVVMLVIDWKLGLQVLILGIIGSFIIYPLSKFLFENTFIRPLFYLADRKERKAKK